MNQEMLEQALKSINRRISRLESYVMEMQEEMIESGALFRTMPKNEEQETSVSCND